MTTSQKLRPMKLRGGGCMLTTSAMQVCEYLEHGMSSILYQRDVCPPDDFEQTKYHGLNLFKVKNQHQARLSHFLREIQQYLVKKEVHNITLSLVNKETREYLEKWVFEMEYDDESDNASGKPEDLSYRYKDPQVVEREISAVLKQILSATSLLPLLEENKVTYQISAQRRPGVPLWKGWSEVKENTSILNEQEIKFRDFSTSVHEVHSKVQYKGVKKEHS